MCYVKKLFSKRQKEKGHSPCRSIRPEQLNVQVPCTDSRLPTGRQGESECGLGQECVGSPSGLRGRHRMAQVRQDEEIMQPRRGVLVSSSVPSIHYMVTTQDDQQYLAVNVTGCCAMIRQIQSLPFSEPLDAASRAKSI